MMDRKELPYGYTETRLVCVTLFTAATVVALFQLCISTGLLLRGIYLKASNMWSKNGKLEKRSSGSRRYRKILPLLTDFLVTTLYFLIFTFGLYGFIRQSIPFMMTSVICLSYILIADGLYLCEHKYRSQSVISSLHYTTASFNFLIVIVLFVSGILHLYTVFKYRKTQVFDVEEESDPAVGIE